jgi:hypothetical protein
MKATFQVLSLITLLISACSQEAKDNQALYDEVMKVHDEVMPKMNDIYKLKEQLKKQIADTTGVVGEKRKAIESAIVKLDAASESMMVWMRSFNPLPDSLGEDKAREYLEQEREKIETVKKEMLNAIEEANDLH